MNQFDYNIHECSLIFYIFALCNSNKTYVVIVLCFALQTLFNDSTISVFSLLLQYFYRDVYLLYSMLP